MTWEKVLAKVGDGERFAGLHATTLGGGLLLTAHIVTADDVEMVDVEFGDAREYPALTPALRAAFWYEREIHDLLGVIPVAHPRLDPLIIPPVNGTGAARHVSGTGMFTIPHGPVRSGVFESVEYLIETPGEEIPHLRVRPFYKHRGVESRFAGVSVEDGLLLAERVEGIASVAHALAYCHAVERVAGCAPPWRARLVRVLHAELERVANHLDVGVKLADAAGLAVATARFGLHKEQVLRLVGRMCGSRFGRGVVCPGGVATSPNLASPELTAEVGRLAADVERDVRLLMNTSSFLDRLRRTGPLPRERAREHGALGPVGRASGLTDDARLNRPYDAYDDLGPTAPEPSLEGDALARTQVRWAELRQSFDLIGRAAGELADADGPLTAPLGDPLPAGRSVGWAEAPQGELIYEVVIDAGRITRARIRPASFHNLALFNEVFAGDILTDFPFIEASFGASIAGVAR
jgi:Ni,Fe-hydrogenase III large subunit